MNMRALSLSFGTAISFLLVFALLQTGVSEHKSIMQPETTLKEIVIIPKEKTIHVGEKFTFKAVVRDAEGANRTDIKIRWKLMFAQNNVDGLAGSINPETGEYEGKYEKKSDTVIAYAPDYPALPEATAKIYVEPKPVVKEDILPLVLIVTGGTTGFIIAIVVVWLLLRRRKEVEEEIPLVERPAPATIRVQRLAPGTLPKIERVKPPPIPPPPVRVAEISVSKPEMPVPVIEKEVAPIPPEKPAPVIEKEVAPIPPEKPAPVIEKEVAPIPPEKPAPVIEKERVPPPEKPVPVIEKEIAPTPPPPPPEPTLETIPLEEKKPKKRRLHRCKSCGKIIKDELKALKCKCAALYHKICVKKLKTCKKCGEDLKK